MLKSTLVAAAAVIATAGAAFAAPTFDLEVLASDEGGALHYVKRDDGASAAIWTDEQGRDTARLLEGAAADRARAEALQGVGNPADLEGDLVMKLFGLSIYAEDDGDQDRARIVINRPNDRAIVIDANDNGPHGDSAHVQIAGADEDGADDFIDDINDAPRSLRAEMKAALGL